MSSTQNVRAFIDNMVEQARHDDFRPFLKAGRMALCNAMLAQVEELSGVEGEKIHEAAARIAALAFQCSVNEDGGILDTDQATGED